MTIRRCSPHVLAAAAGIAAAAHAQVRLERMDMPYSPPSTRRTSIPVINSLPTDNVQRQVNVTAGQLNIVGDAANEPSIAVDPTAPNRLAVGWRQFDTVTNNFRQAGRAYSRDGGRTWTAPGPLTPGTFRSDPVLRASANGTIYYLSLTNTGPGAGYSCQLFTSTDGGATFGPGVEATGGDKQWFCVDNTGSPGAGFLHQAWSIGGVASQAYTRSTNGGATWSATAVTPVPVWGTMDVNSAGTLYIGGITSAGTTSNTSHRCARSTNANNSAVTPTFSTATVPMAGHIGIGITTGPNPDGLLGQASLAVDRSGGPRDGWVYMLCSVVPATGTDPCEVMFNRSTDGGVTWLPNPIRVNNDAAGPGHWQWFGTMSVAPTGRIDAVWNDTRESLTANLSRLYYAWSDDGGTTWQGNTPQGPEWNSYLGFPMQNKIGDYSDMVSDRVGAFLIYAATYNGEEDVYCLRINDYDCNGNGIPDTTDLANGTLHDCDGDGIPDECEAAAGVTVVCPCYANCDSSTTPPILNVQDFSCFLNKFATGDTYANCDGSTTPPTLNVQDFACFLNRYAAGCS